MKISEFVIEDMRRFGKTPTGRKSRDRWKRLRENLNDYASAKGCHPELLDLVNPYFVYDFCSWLYDEKGKDLDPITVYNWTDVLGRMTRNAIRLGYIPNIDVTCNILESLGRDHGVDQAVESSDRRQYERKSVDSGKEFEKLLRLLDKLDEAQEGCWDSLTRQVLLYVFGVTLGGLSYEEIGQLEWSEVKGQTKIYIPRYNRLANFEGIPKIMWQWYNDTPGLRPQDGQKLFPDLKPEREYQFRTDVATFLSQNSIQLFMAQNPLYDFLSVVNSYGISDIDIIDFVKLREFNDTKGYYGELMDKFLLTDFDPQGIMQAQWRVLQLAPGAKIDDVSQAITKIASDITMRGMNCRIEQMIPYKEVNSRSLGRQLKSTVSFFNSYIFVRCLIPEAEMIERVIPSVTFLREPIPEEFPEGSTERKMRVALSMVTLTTGAIHRLRQLFRDFRLSSPAPSLEALLNLQPVPEVV
ncbi:MAG: hypothetical protein LIP02_02840 [Bacteroidales bacterium]|nr:hypothetical protein [Bacteroidales bacterium]